MRRLSPDSPGGLLAAHFAHVPWQPILPRRILSPGNLEKNEQRDFGKVHDECEHRRPGRIALSKSWTPRAQCALRNRLLPPWPPQFTRLLPARASIPVEKQLRCSKSRRAAAMGGRPHLALRRDGRLLTPWDIRSISGGPPSIRLAAVDLVRGSASQAERKSLWRQTFRAHAGRQLQARR